MGAKNIVIVCGKEERKYGDLLSRMISSVSHDESSALQGVSAVVWDITGYEDNQNQLSSDQYIVFIGNNKKIIDKRIGMQSHYDENFMHYEWLGHQAALYLDGGFGKSINKQLTKDIAVGVGLYIVSPILGSFYHSKKYSENEVEVNNAIRQKYTLLIKTFFENGLSKFLS
jgi:hypothetical protein